MPWVSAKTTFSQVPKVSAYVKVKGNFNLENFPSRTFTLFAAVPVNIDACESKDSAHHRSNHIPSYQSWHDIDHTQKSWQACAATKITCCLLTASSAHTPWLGWRVAKNWMSKDTKFLNKARWRSTNKLGMMIACCGLSSVSHSIFARSFKCSPLTCLCS